MLEPLSKRVNDLGWHVQIHMLGDQIVQIEDLLQRLPTPIVFDHMGRIPPPAGVNHPAFRLSASSSKGQYLGQALRCIHEHESRAAHLRGCDASWCKRMLRPRPSGWYGRPTGRTRRKDSKPDDAVMLDLLLDWAPDERTRTGFWSRIRRCCTVFPEAGFSGHSRTPLRPRVRGNTNQPEALAQIYLEPGGHTMQTESTPNSNEKRS